MYDTSKLSHNSQCTIVWKYILKNHCDHSQKIFRDKYKLFIKFSSKTVDLTKKCWYSVKNRFTVSRNMNVLFFHNLLIHSLTIERIIILIHHWHFGIIVTTGSSGIVVGRFTNAGLATVLGKAETTGWTAEKGPSTFMSWRQVGWRGIHSRTHDFPWYVGQASSAKKKNNNNNNK